MPTRWSETLIPTSRQVPAEAEVPSHRLLLRAGFIHRLGAGVYDYLPLGLRSLRKIMAIIREEMNAAGAVEVLLPTLQPVELWIQTGRRIAYGENLFVVKDRHGREQALGPTHEEVMTQLVGAYIESYRQLPVTLYQIQTKFRDEFRPRFGVLRSREFQMKDAYSFHLDLDGSGGLNETYQKQYEAYRRIFERCGLPYEIVEAESGPIGGSASHEFMVPSPTGEDVILKSDKGNYAANIEKCQIGQRSYDLTGEPTGQQENLHTPGCPGIDDVTAFFKKELKTKLRPQNILKSLVCRLDDQWVIAVVRGDHELNLAKLAAVCTDRELGLADDAQVRDAGFTIGFVGPHVAAVRDDVLLVIDPDAAQGGFWVAGANKVDHHVKHFNWQRDVTTARREQHLDRKFKAVWERLEQSTVEKQQYWDSNHGVIVADIRNAVDGDPSPRDDGGILRATKGIEIGHVFKLGCKYSESLNVTVLDENNQRQPLVMGCYGIGVNRILAAAIEREAPQQCGHDENGIIWPATIAPYTVLMTPIKYEGAMRQATDRLATQLEAIPGTGVFPGGIDVLIDDRDERAGVKFKDADLIGIPLRITIGEKALANGQVEVKPRAAKEATLVAVEQATQHITEMIADL